MHISIIGGGITGLTTALALNKLGLGSKVFEQAPQLNEVGAGIWMQPNAMKILDWLGIGDKVRNAGISLDSVEITDQNLSPFRKIEKDLITDGSGNKTTSLHRARLQKVLFDALPADTVHLGKEYTHHTARDDRIMLRFSDTRDETGILLGADGIHSPVRKQMFPDSHIRDTGQVCWRGIARIDLPEEFTAAGKEAWGKGVRFGFANISLSEVYWFAVSKTSNKNENKLDVKELLLEKYKSFHPLITEIINKTQPEKIIRNNIIDLKRLNSWYQGSVCLLGDAAHATTPNMGQGAGQGIEDAYHLSNILARNSNHKEAFALFERERRKKVDYVVNNSWRLGKLAHSHPGQSMMKILMKLTPKATIRKQMRKLYSIKEY